MTEIKKEEGAEGGDNTEQPTVDAFGMEDNPKLPAKEEKKEEDNKGGGKEEEEKKGEKDPQVEALEKQIEDVKKEYGGNLSGQRKVIEALQAEIKELKEGKGKDGKNDDPDLPFPEIKWSKDLTREEREEMTDKEIEQMDTIAKMQENQNKLYLEQKNGQKAQETKAVEDRQSLVKSTALELAKEASGKDDPELANQIIESVKQFNLEGLDEATIKERVATAHTLLPDYTPPKEQKKVDGKAVKTTKNDDDPFGVDAIVEGATKAQSGSYEL